MKWLTKICLVFSCFSLYFALFNQKIHLEFKAYYPLGLFSWKLSYSATMSLEEIGFNTHREFCTIHHHQVSQSLRFWILQTPVNNFLKDFYYFLVKSTLPFHKPKISTQTSHQCIVSCIFFFWKAAVIPKRLQCFLIFVLISRYFEGWLAWYQEANLSHEMH